MRRAVPAGVKPGWRVGGRFFYGSASGGFAKLADKSPVNGKAMIEVENLTKRFAGRTALSAISFTVARGEVVALLGPNGAGKSTTMRILSCYLPASAGTVRVGGRDVFTESREVRRRIGYMPENNPLHPDMRVREYLKFRARLKGLTRKASRERVDRVIEQCGLVDVSRRIIGHLSKGYRQRVGLADALVHEPELLILDEPTIGLDPNQIRSVRQLIKGLATTHTVLISTHILPEAEMTCNRMVILYEGRILAAGTAQELQRLMGGDSQVVAEIAAPIEELNECWAAMAEVEHFDISAAEGEYFRCALTPQNGVDLRPLVFATARDRGWSLRELKRNRHSLEDIYVQVTRPDEEEEA
jgi:ABC-2 type transport system ATP-binding protein